MSIKAIYKHFQKDPTFYTESLDGYLYVSLANPKGEKCEVYLFEVESSLLGKTLMLLSPIAEVAQVDLNKLLSSEGPLTTYIMSWQRFGLKISEDSLDLRKFISIDREPLEVRRQAVAMAWSAKELSNLVGK